MRRLWPAIVAGYLAGVGAVWLLQTFIGFDAWPWREVGAVLWPLLPLAIILKKGD